jgi:hypothetical protein
MHAPQVFALFYLISVVLVRFGKWAVPAILLLSRHIDGGCGRYLLTNPTGTGILSSITF